MNTLNTLNTLNNSIKITINTEIFYLFLKTYKIKLTKQITDQILSFGYEQTENNNFIIMLTTCSEPILGPITLLYIFNKYKTYESFINKKYNYYEIIVKQEKRNVNLEKYTDINNLANREFGLNFIREDLLCLVDFFNSQGLQISTKPTKTQHCFNNSIIRRLQTCYDKNKHIFFNKNFVTDKKNNFAEHLCNIGYKEICINPIINKLTIKELQNIFKQDNVITEFLSRDYLVNYLIHAYVADYDQFYYLFFQVFTIDNVYCVNTKTNKTNILIVKTCFCKHSKHLNTITSTLLFFNKSADFYFEKCDNVCYIMINKTQIGICGFYRKRMFVELCYNNLQNVKQLKPTVKFYDYNIVCNSQTINKIIKQICLSTPNINNYKLIDVYVTKDCNKYTFRFFLSKHIDYNYIQQVIEKFV